MMRMLIQAWHRPEGAGDPQPPTSGLGRARQEAATQQVRKNVLQATQKTVPTGCMSSCLTATHGQMQPRLPWGRVAREAVGPHGRSGLPMAPGRAGWGHHLATDAHPDPEKLPVQQQQAGLRGGPCKPQWACAHLPAETIWRGFCPQRTFRKTTCRTSVLRDQGKSLARDHSRLSVLPSSRHGWGHRLGPHALDRALCPVLHGLCSRGGAGTRP